MTRPPPSPDVAMTCLPVDGVGEVLEGDDLAATFTAALGPDGLDDGDVLVVTSKVISKAEGRLLRLGKDAALADETIRVVARRGPTSIVRTRHGLVLAGAGIDSSNTEVGTVLLLPLDPDASARRLRDRLRELTGRNVAVVVSDTAGRAWRHGQTDLAIGAAGIAVMHDYAGVEDHYGNELAVTAPAVADEMAAAADLVKGKLARRPGAVLRGLAAWVLPAGRHGGGAGNLVREPDQDMFGFGSREAVVAALGADPADRASFGRAAPAEELARVLTALVGPATLGDDHGVEVPLAEADPRTQGRREAVAEAAAFALGWKRQKPPAHSHDQGTALRFARATP